MFLGLRCNVLLIRFRRAALFWVKFSKCHHFVLKDYKGVSIRLEYQFMRMCVELCLANHLRMMIMECILVHIVTIDRTRQQLWLAVDFHTWLCLHRPNKNHIFSDFLQGWLFLEPYSWMPVVMQSISIYFCLEVDHKAYRAEEDDKRKTLI